MNRVVAQYAVFVRIVCEAVASFFFSVQSAFYGSNPQGTFAVFVDGVYGVMRQGMTVLRVVAIVLYRQALGGKLIDTSVVGAYPDVVAFDSDAVDEVAVQQVAASVRVFVFDSFEVVFDGVVDVEAFQTTDDELLVAGDGQIGQVVLR